MGMPLCFQPHFSSQFVNMSSDSTEQQQFQAEVQQVLDIVINSLYTDKEIFVRELISNATDALEKLKHLQLTEKDIFDSNLGLEINITTDDTAHTLTISDYGVGMTREELVENLGTIAHSGSRAFVQALSETERKQSPLIGQFGVGFYSAFMVAKQVRVYTHSWRPDGEHLVWTSDGRSGYRIDLAPGQRRGCKIVLELRDDCHEFANKSQLESILKTYSNFVPFPIFLNGERINTIEALWLKPKKEISAEAYTEFYRFVAKAWDEPLYRFHFQADAPLEINSLLFVPAQNREKIFGPGNLTSHVALYCKKVLIDPQPQGLLPEWLRFLSGVVDSADLPLNISRESMQDSGLLKKLNRTVTNRFLKFLEKEAKNSAETYEKFYLEFSRFLKEGVCMDAEHRDALAKLLRFESSFTDPGKLTSFEDYLTRAKTEQKDIFYLCGENRGALEAGPYLEAFKARGIEVIYFFDKIDHYVLDSLREFQEKKIVPANRDSIELGDSDLPESAPPLEPAVLEALCAFLKAELKDSVEDVFAGKRLVQSPAAALIPEHAPSPQMREILRSLNPSEEAPPLKTKLEINPRHELIKRLAASRESNPERAKLVASQLLDSALLSAGLLDNPAEYIKRGYQVMQEALQ